MAVTITVGTTAGLNYDEYLGTSTASFLYGHAADPAYGEFYGTGHTIFGGPQHLVSGSAVDGTVTPTEKAVLATGDFDYTFSTHTLDGTLNKVEFGYGPKVNPAGLLGADSYVTLDTATELTIDGLNLTTSGSGADTVHSILYGFLSDTAAPLTGYLATLTSGVEFLGNAGADTFTGYGYNDVISGGGGADTLNGAGGDDTIDGGLGNDAIDGGTGADTVTYAGAGSAVTINLGAGTSSGGLGADTLANIENAIGSASNDTLFGGAATNRLTGGAGNDSFNFASGTNASADTIADFNGISLAGGDVDVINLRAVAGLTAWGGTTAGANSVWYATGSTDTVVYGDTSGDGVADFSFTLAGYVGGLSGATSGSAFDILV
ncbi:hypothetical protein MesoLjLc_01760 [Mesorhizobium sp. L-8-10]|uniref:calcium-binding protein n=1 Tax=Mesorhizobium sp. L-8-10 TaxID=2744523 RepID=UPI00192966F7|nr:calcium-binding protein [Mesorhizobium sp. L-8-10]BCH28246.1 hypothetical protein MesoLjLc_01760 [Mesorhizobium sp. L-8-10]